HRAHPRRTLAQAGTGKWARPWPSWIDDGSVRDRGYDAAASGNASLTASRNSTRVRVMADKDDLEFTYSLIDRVFRLSMGELADFSVAMYDGDFSLTLEEAQTRKHDYIVERLGIGPGRRVLAVARGCGPVACTATGRA